MNKISGNLVDKITGVKKTKLIQRWTEMSSVARIRVRFVGLQTTVFEWLLFLVFKITRISSKDISNINTNNSEGGTGNNNNSRISVINSCLHCQTAIKCSQFISSPHRSVKESVFFRIPLFGRPLHLDDFLSGDVRRCQRTHCVNDRSFVRFVSDRLVPIGVNDLPAPKSSADWIGALLVCSHQIDFCFHFVLSFVHFLRPWYLTVLFASTSCLVCID